MRKIKLTPVLEFSHRAEFAIMDITEVKDPETEAGKKRGVFSVDYTPYDLDEVRNAGATSLEEALEYYRSKIYGLVKYYISGDWEDAGGLEDALATVEKYIAPKFQD